jgi:ferredoxin
VPETNVVSETKYATRIYLGVRATADEAGRTAARVYQDFLGRLRRTAPTVRELRLDMEMPAPRKEDEGVFTCWSTLKAIVPDDLTHPAATNARDAWRRILRETFNASCHQHHEAVHHTSSYVQLTREVLPGEESEAEAAPVEQKPKEMIPVKVILGGKEYSVEIPKDENLLDGVNEKGVAVKWDCKSGVCDTCKIKVVAGAENLSAPNDAEKNMLGDLVNKGHRLCCQVTAHGPCTIEQ